MRCFAAGTLLVLSPVGSSVAKRPSESTCPPDRLTNCQERMAKGECLLRIKEMAHDCPRACQVCGADDVRQLLKEPYPSENWESACKDNSPECHKLASKENCRKQPVYFNEECRASCHVCGRGPVFCDTSLPQCRQLLLTLARYRVPCGMSAACIAASARSHILDAWVKVRGRLDVALKVPGSDEQFSNQMRFARVALERASALMQGFRGMVSNLSPSSARLLPFYFPRSAIGGELELVLSKGLKTLPRGTEAFLAFADFASEVVTRIWDAAITDEERDHFAYWKNLVLASSSKNAVADGPESSFGEQLHLVDPANPSVPHEVMESWEIPWMKKMVDRMFERAPVQKQPLEILEIGWGQGISGRMMLSAALESRSLSYSVVEPHPEVIKNAYRVSKARFGSVPFKVLEGTWQEVLPKLPARSFNCIFADFFEPENRLLAFESWHHHRFFLLSVYRLLKPRGVFTWFDNFGDTVDFGPSILGEQVRFYAEIFSELELSFVNGLRPPANSSYYTSSQALVPVGVK